MLEIFRSKYKSQEAKHRTDQRAEQLAFQEEAKLVPVQTYLKDIVGLVLDHCNKVNIAIKWVTQIFWFPSAHRSYVY